MPQLKPSERRRDHVVEALLVLALAGQVLLLAALVLHGPEDRHSTSFVGVVGLPRWVLARLVKRRQTKFVDEFANAIDVIVRGVKSGLPLIECLSIIAREAPQPISGEFTELVEQPDDHVALVERADGRKNLAG